ncbi:MAG: hypothetical protein IKC22_01580 [Bacilli bacterium]|nr:hypothetical protein [Methanobrevibacter sp.]MBR2652782.1 hypothetical protein [bacterium]MBR2891051.1 hypothetical protein [Bacilli bacterium]MBR4003288.1 hypothetical protein [Clostridia bacterium]
MIKENKDFIIKLILFVIIFIESIFLVLYIERNKQNTQKIDDLKQENYHLVYENNNLINENERLGMMNSEIWELFIADKNIDKGGETNE